MSSAVPRETQVEGGRASRRTRFIAHRRPFVFRRSFSAVRFCVRSNMHWTIVWCGCLAVGERRRHVDFVFAGEFCLLASLREVSIRSYYNSVELKTLSGIRSGKDYCSRLYAVNVWRRLTRCPVSETTPLLFHQHDRYYRTTYRMPCCATCASTAASAATLAACSA